MISDIIAVQSIVAFRWLHPLGPGAAPLMLGLEGRDRARRGAARAKAAGVASSSAR